MYSVNEARSPGSTSSNSAAMYAGSSQSRKLMTSSGRMVGRAGALIDMGAMPWARSEPGAGLVIHS